MSENIYPKGITFFPPNEKAPEYVLGTLTINPESFNEWLKQRKELLTPSAYGDQIRLTQIRNKEGKIYFKVDTYKKQEEKHVDVSGTSGRDNPLNIPQEPDSVSDDLPF